jgi:hypothetical protein
LKGDFSKTPCFQAFPPPYFPVLGSGLAGIALILPGIKGSPFLRNGIKKGKKMLRARASLNYGNILERG